MSGADGGQLGLDLGAAARPPAPALPDGVHLLAEAALVDEDAVLGAIDAVVAAAPLQHMVTPGGHTMSVAMTSCGALGWVSDRAGYRYARRDPARGAPWPDLPDALRALAQRAAAAAGFGAFQPDSCLINDYRPGARMTLHQDRNERDLTAPIVSVSLGLPATFQLGGDARTDPVMRVPLVHGDVLVWGGPARLRFHGVLPVRAGHHPRLGPRRINLTFRRAG